MDDQNKLTVKDNITIDMDQAEKIADLINNTEWARPDNPFTKEEILEDPKGFFIDYVGDTMVGVGKLKQINPYEYEMFNIIVAKDYRQQGMATWLVQGMEGHVKTQGGGILQAAVDPKNEAIIHLLESREWLHTLDFMYPGIKQITQLWNKAV